MKVITRYLKVQIGIPNKVPTPDDDAIERSLSELFDVISAQEFDTLDEHSTWDFLAVQVVPPLR